MVLWGGAVHAVGADHVMDIFQGRTQRKAEFGSARLCLFIASGTAAFSSR